MTDQATINLLIGENEIQKVFDLLLPHTKEQAPEQHETLLLLAARWEKMRQQEIENTEDPDELRREHSRILKSLIQVNSAVFGKPSFLGSRKSKRLAAVATVALSVASIFWMFQPRQGFEAVVDIFCQRAAFTFLNGSGSVFDNAQLKQVRVQNFSQIGIQTNEVQLDLGADGKTYETAAAVPDGLLTLKPIPDLGGGEFSAHPLRLFSLDYKPGARLSVGISQDNARELQLDVLHSARTEAEFDFSGNLFFYANLVEHSGLEAQGLPDQLAGLVVTEEARKIFVESEQALVTFFLEFADSLNFKVQKMAVNNLDFSFKEGQDRLSSILSGNIQLTDGRGNPYRKIALGKKGEVVLDPVELLVVNELSVNPEGIWLQLSGKMKNISTGIDLASLKPQNPLTGEWLWQNHTYTVLAVGLALLAALLIMWFGFPTEWKRLRG